MRLGSLGTVQSFLVRCNWSQFCVEMKRKEAWVFGNGSSSVLGEGTVQFNLFPYNYCCSPSYPKRGLGLWERFSLFFREVISHSSLLK